MEINLEQKIKEAKEKLPGIKLDEFRFDQYGHHIDRRVSDIEIVETDNYIVASAKWEERVWDRWQGISNGGIARNGWLSISYKPKTNEDLTTIETKKVCVNHQHDPRKDRDLMSYILVNFEHVGDDQIKGGWMRKDGEVRMKFSLDLKNCNASLKYQDHEDDYLITKKKKEIWGC